MSEKVITVEELEEILNENKLAWKVLNDTHKGSDPEFREISGEFDPSCLVEAAREHEQEFPWLPDLLERSGNGRWKYSGFVVFDAPPTDEVAESETYSGGAIFLNHKSLGDVIVSVSEGRLVDIELIALL